MGSRRRKNMRRRKKECSSSKEDVGGENLCYYKMPMPPGFAEFLEESNPKPNITRLWMKTQLEKPKKKKPPPFHNCSSPFLFGLG
jgi:hypothetical protein